MKYLSYSITLRPKGGVTDSDVDLVKKITVKYCKFYLIITEKEGEARHVHAALYLKKETTSSSFNQMMKRVFEKTLLERDSIWRFAYKSKPMYNDDFVTKYMAKEDNTKEIDRHLPDVVERCSYYRDIADKRNEYVADPFFHRLEQLYLEDIPKGKIGANPEPTNEELKEWLGKMMYHERKIRIIRDSRKFRRVVKCLRYYIMKICDYPMERGDINSEMGPMAGTEPYGYGQNL